MTSELITVKEAAAFCRVSPSKIYELAKHKGFPCVRIGKRVLIIREKMMPWLESLEGY